MTDMINHPPHYAVGWSNGAEVIDITENLNFNLGNCVKYVARAGKKDPAKELEDLKKAQWYLTREIDRVSSPESAKRETRVVALLTEDCRGSEWICKATGSRYKVKDGWWNFRPPNRGDWIRYLRADPPPSTYTEVIE